MWVYHTAYTSIPFFFAAKFVCCILVSIFNQTKVPGEHIHSVSNKQILLTKVIVFGPSQKDSLVFNIKLKNKKQKTKNKHICR